MHTHVKVVGSLFIAFGIIGVIAAGFSGALFGALTNLLRSSGDDGAVAGSTFVSLAGTFITNMLLVLAVPEIICGWGLLKLKPWARILGIVLAAISLFKVPPIGTLFGAYALYVLFQKDTEQLLAPVPR